METGNELAVIRGHAELYERTWHLFTSAKTEIACAANDLFTWVSAKAAPAMPAEPLPGFSVRKLYRPAVLLDPVRAGHVRRLAEHGARIRITTDEINETILIDRRVAILAGDTAHGERSFSVVWAPDVVAAVGSLFDAAWRAATDLAGYDRELAELRTLAPRILELLGSGCKDETAARTLTLSVRTYRRRVAELMAALGATSRFQAGVRARQLGLV
ncbi:DNA-binding response regulator [Actinophytocola sp.]|uniref:DNA-binding response regulator n=1 Tax=Actinophytocola sp. TaxID=1872138 RepID=UPI002D806599|nr:DNA-binding response regulator [Actinophytocola sp.]HET9137862.1 DNA-binding response regulator [Actinophytocola sp.]